MICLAPRHLQGSLAVTIPRRLLPLLALIFCAALAAPPARAEPYRVRAGDVIDLSIFAQPELSGSRRVHEDGSIRLHLIGEILVAGMTLSEVSEAVSAAAERAFQSPASVIAEIASYRDIFLLGDVNRPGAHPFTPGLTVIKAVALGGGARQAALPVGEDGRRVFDERRRLLLAQARIKETEVKIAAIDAELQLLDAEGSAALEAPRQEDAPMAGDLLDQQSALISARREVITRSVDGAKRQEALATEEAELFRRRSEIVARQLENTEKNLDDIDTLVARGLARRERQLDLAVSADDYRSDALEIAAFEARARQTVANAENNAAIAVSRYREALIADRIAAVSALETATIDFAVSRDFLQNYGGAASAIPSLEPLMLRYEIIRDGVTIPAGEGDALRPGDVLRATLSAASEG